MAPPRTLWSVGSADRGYSEFAMAGHYSDYYAEFPRGVHYKVGASVAGRDWPYIVPGPSDSFWAGGKVRTFRISFALPATPIGAHALVNTVDTQPRTNTPVLDIVVNGHPGIGCALPAGASDNSLKEPRSGLPYRLAVPLPSSYLSQGPNDIVLTVIPGSWLLYDSVSLEAGAPSPDSPLATILRAATTNERRNEGGFARQVVRVSAIDSGAVGPATVRVSGAETGGRIIDLGPGVNTFDVRIPPIENPSPLRVTLTAGGLEDTI